MHFHLPKPLHGWRAFVGEVGIIVIGVLIALGAQQVAEAVRDRQLADQTRAAVTDEIGQNLLSLSLRDRRAVYRVAAWRDSRHDRPVGQERDVQDALMGGASTTSRCQRRVSRRLWVLATSPCWRPRSNIRSAWSSTGLMISRRRRILKATIGPRCACFRTGPTRFRRALARRSGSRCSRRRLSIIARLLIRQELPRAARFGFHPERRQFDDVAKGIWKGGHYTPSICVPIDTPPAKANAMTGQQTPLPF